MTFNDLKELGRGILITVALFVVFGLALFLAEELDSNGYESKKHVPLNSGVIYEKYEIPAHQEIPSNHNGYLQYDDAYVISYQKTGDGELKQDQWYVDKESYNKYEVGDEFVYDPEYCSSDCSWTRINGNDDVWTKYIIFSGAF